MVSIGQTCLDSKCREKILEDAAVSDSKSDFHLRFMGEDVLTQKAEEVGEVTPEIEKLADDMLSLMYEEEGCGLAAPQIGAPLRLVVIDCDYDPSSQTKKNPYVLINPEIVELSDETAKDSEGCLSFPGLSVEIERPVGVVVEAEDLEGNVLRYEVEGSLLARCLQHEIDHLNGVTMLDHLGPIARMKAISTVREKMQGDAAAGAANGAEGETATHSAERTEKSTEEK